jgi:hypothetical protein
MYAKNILQIYTEPPESVKVLRFLPKASLWGKTGAINRSTTPLFILQTLSTGMDFRLRTAKVNGNSVYTKGVSEIVLLFYKIRKGLF